MDITVKYSHINLHNLPVIPAAVNELELTPIPYMCWCILSLTASICWIFCSKINMNWMGRKPTKVNCSHIITLSSYAEHVILIINLNVFVLSSCSWSGDHIGWFVRCSEKYHYFNQILIMIRTYLRYLVIIVGDHISWFVRCSKQYIYFNHISVVWRAANVLK